MPEKHVYFSMGTIVGSGICLLIAKRRHALRKSSVFLQCLYRKEPQWFLYFPIIIFMMGFWGLIPDIIHLFGWLPKEMTRRAIFDIFFFHSTLERIEDTSPSLDHYLNLIGEICLIAIALTVMIYYVLQIKKVCSSNKIDQ